MTISSTWAGILVVTANLSSVNDGIAVWDGVFENLYTTDISTMGIANGYDNNNKYEDPVVDVCHELLNKEKEMSPSRRNSAYARLVIEVIFLTLRLKKKNGMSNYI